MVEYFLAGPTPRDSKVESWRPNALEYLKEYEGNIFIPERQSGWDNVDYVEQVDWEMSALSKCNIILFWIPRNMETMPGLSTNLEFGLFLKDKDKKIMYGRPDTSENNRYLDKMFSEYRSNMPIYNDLAELCYDTRMLDHFYVRTNKHIDLFNSIYYELTGGEMIGHDLSKFREPELYPYILTSWMYRYPDFEAPADFSGDAATFHHIKNNRHHPEYWDDSLTENPINSENRDLPSGIMVDATKMPFDALDELCCDWKAVSIELNTNPFEWAENNINVRWQFTIEQENYIYRTLEKLKSINLEF